MLVADISFKFLVYRFILYLSPHSLPLPPKNVFIEESGCLLCRTFHSVGFTDCILDNAVNISSVFCVSTNWQLVEEA